MLVSKRPYDHSLRHPPLDGGILELVCSMQNQLCFKAKLPEGFRPGLNKGLLLIKQESGGSPLILFAGKKKKR